MYKLVFPAFVLMTINVFGQATPPPQPPPQQERPDFIVTVQMGTDTLKNGTITVKLTEQTTEEMKQAMASPNYTVMLTPRGDCGQLNLSETTATGFTVKQKGAAVSKGIFDYVVYVKQKRPMMPMRPKPPGAPQPPASPNAQPPAQQ